MRLTVGSLPSAVYWRRRAMVVAGVFAAFIVAWVAIPGAGGGEHGALRPKATDPGAPGASSSAEPLLVPTIEETGQPAAQAPPADPTHVAIRQPAAACADDSLVITPASDTMKLARGQGTRLAIKIKNVSPSMCTRDLGADAQELYLQQGAAKVYSSDACDPRRGTSVRMLAPGIEYMFTVTWDGTSTAAGCSDRQPPPAGQYQLIGRLGEKVSGPVLVTIS